MKNISARIIGDIVLFILTIFGFWYIVIVGTIYLSFVQKRYIEIVLFGIVYDSLFRMIPGEGYHGYWGTILSTTIFLLIVFIKKLIRKN